MGKFKHCPKEEKDPDHQQKIQQTGKTGKLKAPTQGRNEDSTLQVVTATAMASKTQPQTRLLGEEDQGSTKRSALHMPEAFNRATVPNYNNLTYSKG